MRVKMEKDIILTNLDNEIALLNQKNGRYFCLNETGARIWELLYDSKDTKVALDAVLEEYDVDQEVLKADMDKLLSQLADAGLIEVLA